MIQVKLKVLAVTGDSDIAEAHQFIGIAKKGVDLEVMCPSSARYFQLLKDNGVKVTELDLKSRFERLSCRLIRERLLSNKSQILHTFNNKATSNGLMASKGLPVKVVAYRGIVGNVSFFNPISWTTYLHPRISRIICVAEAVRQYFLNMRFLWFRFPKHKAVTIYKGHDVTWYQDPPADLSEFGIPSDAFVVGTVANIRPRKGIPYLVKALDFLQKGNNVYLLIVGKMKNSKLHKAIRNSQYKERIVLTGFRKDAPALIGACDTYVLPAIKREGLPKTVIEAMAYEIPPIVTDSGGSPELLEEGKSGLIVPPKNAEAIARAIEKLKDNDKLRLQIGKNAKKRLAVCFTVNDTVNETIALYEDVIRTP